MPELAIFPARRRGDLPLVRDLARRIWQRHYPGIITQAQIDYMLELGYNDEALAKFTVDEGAGLALVHVDYDPAGFAAWYRPGAPGTTKLDKLYVLQEVQGRGVGRYLMAHVEQAARADGARTLILNVNKGNAASIAFYERCGFGVRESVVVDIGQGFVMDDFVMAKALA
jgi:GNAT superfamily N-acetyltransferase